MPVVPTPPEPDAGPGPGAPGESTSGGEVLAATDRSAGTGDEAYDPYLLRERRPYARLLLWVVILAGLGVFVWWAVTFGPALIKAQLDGSVPNPRPTIEAGSFVPGGEGDWATVYLPDGSSDALEYAGRGAVELVRSEGRTIARMASTAGSSANRILVEIPDRVMEQLKGEAATFELTLKSTEPDGQQFAVFCEFASLGACGRKRFNARDRFEAFIFDVLVNEGNLQPGERAYLAINTDVNLGGKALDLQSIRVRSGN